ncbi:MAG: ArnT family glycosyltransferase [Bradymonadia bacterium]
MDDKGGALELGRVKMACLIMSLIATQWILAARLPIVADEAYYASWATNPALGYFDHPPMIAWLLAIAPIRAVSIFCFLAGAGFLYRAARVVCGGAAHWTLLLLVGCPLGLVGGVIATPDGPLFLFWGMVLFGVETRRNWLLCIGVAGCVLSKASVLIVLPGLWWYLDRRQRLVVLYGLLLCLPHLIWSLEHDWAPYAYQGSRTFTGFHTPEFLGGQLAFAGPTLMLLAHAGARTEVATARRAFIGLVLPSLGAFLAVSMLMRVEANWPLLAWASAAVYGPSFLSSRLKRLCLQFACLTGSLGIVLAVIAGEIPDRFGPDRASDAFLSCVETTGNQTLVGLRYQDVALVRHAGKDVGYFRPQGRRKSQYDMTEVPQSPCGKVAVAPPAVRSRVCTEDLEQSRCSAHMGYCACSEK